MNQKYVELSGRLNIGDLINGIKICRCELTSSDYSEITIYYFDCDDNLIATYKELKTTLQKILYWLTNFTE